MLKKILIFVMFIISILIMMQISTVWANTNKNEDKELIEKVNQEIIYLQKILEDNLYLIENEEWEKIDKNVDNLYSYWNTVILDLNELQVKNAYLANFGKKIDELTLAINDKNVTIAKIRISELCHYLYLYVQSYSENEIFNYQFNVKKNILLIYIISENRNWDLMNQYIIETEESIKSILNSNEVNQDYHLNRLYISLKELENSIKIQNLDLFYKKYELLKQELSNIKC